MGLAAVRGAPRSVRGGRSTRYEERRLRRGSVRAWAPSWSDATAEAVLKVLEDACERATGNKVLQKKKVAGLLKSTSNSSCRDMVMEPMASLPPRGACCSGCEDRASSG